MKSGWFRRLIPSPRHHQKTTDQNQSPSNEDVDSLGVTPELIEFVKTFTVDTFTSFQLQRDEDVSSCSQTELSDWQARHATLVLSKAKEISDLRYTLCPRRLKEHLFWEIYFRLVQRHVKKYEQHAIRIDLMKKSIMERDKKPPQDNGYEVEMAEAKKEFSSSSLISEDQL